jgi:hypothetical protein
MVKSKSQSQPIPQGKPKDEIDLGSEDSYSSEEDPNSEDLAAINEDELSEDDDYSPSESEEDELIEPYTQLVWKGGKPYAQVMWGDRLVEEVEVKQKIGKMPSKEPLILEKPSKIPLAIPEETKPPKPEDSIVKPQ